MSRALVGLGIALALGCAEREPSHPTSDRLDTLAQAFALRREDPVAALRLFDDAGPGPILETARLEAWSATLERTGDDPDAWSGFLEARPPARLAGAATLALARSLVVEDRRADAVEVLLAAPEDMRHSADRALLEFADDEVAAAAARRLAVSAPRRLREHSRTIERAAVATLDLDEAIRRAGAWRSAGLGSRGAAELRRLRGRGALEIDRRKELARCELDAGSTTRALNALPPRDAADAEELTLRAEAYRRRGWSRMPDRSAARSFTTCLEEAKLAVDRGDGGFREPALVLALECGTEAGRLDDALGAWRDLEASGWTHSRRSWLGRRLGVALAQSGEHDAAVARLVASLPNHARCLGYWRHRNRPTSLEDLGAVAITDLYGTWARDRTDAPFPSAPYDPPAPVGETEPPTSVAWLLDHGGEREASSEWQRHLGRRRAGRSETMAASALAARAGLPNTAIRTLRRTWPEIGTVAIAGVPSDAARAYLPLRWRDHLVAAGRETGLDPWLIAAVARQESTFTALARSPAGAVGVLQLLPSTGRLRARNLGLPGRADLEDPAVNIRLGAHELAWLVRRYGAVEPALAAYNAGDRRARRWSKRWSETDVFVEAIPIPETYNYVRRVVFLADAYRQVQAGAWEERP